MSKKILSIVLAVVMLFSVCAVAANAAVVEGKSIGLKVVSDAAIGAPAGTVVSVKVYYTIPDDAGEVLLQAGPIAVAWNSAAYAPNTTSTNNTISDCRTWGASYVDVMKSTAAVTKAPSATIISTHYANATDSYGWDSACRVVETLDSANGYSTNTGFPVDPDCELFTMTFVAKRTLTANDVIGIPYGTYGDANLKVQAKVDGSNTPSMFAANVVDFSDATAAPEYDVYSIGGKNDEVAVKRANKADSTKYDIGTFFAFKADTIATDFVDGTSANIEAISATITAKFANGDTTTVGADPINYVYDVSAAKDMSEFGFVVTISGIPNDDTSITSYTITPVMTTKDGNTYSCETITVNVADLA